MSIDIETVYKTANLARLHISEADAANLQKDLESILSLFSVLDREEITALKPLGHPLEYTQPLREDVAHNKDLHSVIEQNDPFAEDGFITVPKVIS